MMHIVGGTDFRPDEQKNCVVCGRVAWLWPREKAGDPDTIECAGCGKPLRSDTAPEDVDKFNTYAAQRWVRENDPEYRKRVLEMLEKQAAKIAKAYCIL